MSDVDVISNELEESSNNNLKGKLILLKGVWGSGKTHRWEHQIAPAIKRKNKIYVSLFGMQNVDEVKQILYLKAIDCKFSNKVSKFMQIVIALALAIAVFFYGANFILFKDFSQLRDGIQSFYIIALIITLLISVFLFLPVAKSIVLYFLDTALGLNCNSISLTKLLTPDETVICFDDFERIAKSGQPDAFLGYFNTLARTHGYHILFIAYITQKNSGKQSNNSSAESSRTSKGDKEDQCLKLLLDYQEKLFDKIFEHEQSLTEILEQKDINDTLKGCLLELNSRLENSDDYDIESAQYIEKIRGNLRIFFKIINNMDIIYHHISADKLNSNGIHEDVIKFVCGLTLAVETGYCSNVDDIYTKRLHNVFLGNLSAEKTFANFLMPYMSNTYNSLYDLIYKGIKTDQFEEEIFPQEKQTLFEKAIYEFSKKYYLEYRFTEIEKHFNKIQNILIESDNLFSSYPIMLKTLGRYCWLLSCMKKNLKGNTKIKQKLFKNIHEMIKKEHIPLIAFERISFSITADDENFKISEKLIITQIYKYIVESSISGLPKNKIIEYFLDYNENKDKYLQDIICIILISNEKLVNIQKIAENDYSTFIRTWRKLNEYSFSLFEYKKLCQIMNYNPATYKKLLNKFRSVMAKLANGMSDNTPEVINYKQFQKDIKNKLQAFENGMKNL